MTIGGRAANGSAERTAHALPSFLRSEADRALLGIPVAHDELRALLPAYAAGDLDEAAADAVRTHLASGCGDCLHDLFARPVGKQVPAPAPRHGAPSSAVPTQIDDHPAPANHAARWWIAFIPILGLALIALAGWSIYDLRLREVRQRETAARLARRVAEVETTRADLGARVDRLGRELDAAREEATRHADAVRATAEESARLGASLEAAQDRIATLLRSVRRRDAEIERLLTNADEGQLVRELIATPGVEMLRLRAVPPFGDVRGHVLWHPTREVMVLYAFDLPGAGGGTRFRVWLDWGSGRSNKGPTVTAGARGDVVLPIRLDAPPAELRGIQVVREPAAEPVLAGEVGRSAG